MGAQGWSAAARVLHFIRKHSLVLLIPGPGMERRGAEKEQEQEQESKECLRNNVGMLVLHLQDRGRGQQTRPF